MSIKTQLDSFSLNGGWEYSRSTWIGLGCVALIVAALWLRYYFRPEEVSSLTYEIVRVGNKDFIATANLIATWKGQTAGATPFFNTTWLKNALTCIEQDLRHPNPKLEGYISEHCFYLCKDSQGKAQGIMRLEPSFDITDITLAVAPNLTLEKISAIEKALLTKAEKSGQQVPSTSIRLSGCDENKSRLEALGFQECYLCIYRNSMMKTTYHGDVYA